MDLKINKNVQQFSLFDWFLKNSNFHLILLQKNSATHSKIHPFLPPPSHTSPEKVPRPVSDVAPIL